MRRLIEVLVASMLVFFSVVAHADDGGDAGDAGEDAAVDGIRETTVPDNWGCGVAERERGSGSGNGSGSGICVVAIGIGIAIVARRRKAAAALVAVFVMTFASAARADEADDKLREVKLEEPPMRHVTIAVSPLGPLVARWGGALEILLASHHAIGVSGAYVHSRTDEDTNNLFRGATFELGYRYYFGDNGARGFFLGPSFLLGRLEAVPERGASTDFWNLGGALDAGFSALLADRVLFALGAGVQYTAPTATFPAQELPASIYARPGVRPRLLLAIGLAF